MEDRTFFSDSVFIAAKRRQLITPIVSAQPNASGRILRELKTDIVCSVLIVKPVRTLLFLSYLLYGSAFGMKRAVFLLEGDRFSENICSIAAISVFERNNVRVFFHDCFVDGSHFGGIHNILCVIGQKRIDL